MVKAYSLESVQKQFRQTRSLDQLPSDGTPLCCALSDSGQIFLASNRRTVGVYSIDDFQEIVTIGTVGVPRGLFYSEIGDYILTLEATDGPAARIPLTDVFAYTAWSLSGSGQQLPGRQSARTCLIVDADEAEEEAKAGGDVSAAGRGGDQGGGAIGRSKLQLPPLRPPARGLPAVHRFRTSGSSPAVAVCPTSGRLAVADAGTVVVYAYVSSERRFAFERRVMLPFLAHEVALLAERCCAAVGDSRLVVTWSSSPVFSGGSCSLTACAQPPPPSLPASLLPLPSSAPVSTPASPVDREAGQQSLAPPSALLLPSMLRRLHDRRTPSFELTGRDAMSVPLPGNGGARDPLVLYKRFDGGQELHSLALLPVASTDRGCREAITFVSTRYAGYLFAVGDGMAQLICTFSYVGTAFKALISPTVLTVCTAAGIEIYTSKVFTSQDRALQAEVFRDFKNPLLIAMKDVKGLVHCKWNSTTTCYFTDHWQAYDNPGMACLAADLLHLAQELVVTSANSALQVAVEGLRVCRLDASVSPAAGSTGCCSRGSSLDCSGAQDGDGTAFDAGTETVAETFRSLCLLAAHSVMTVEHPDRSGDVTSNAAGPKAGTLPEECVVMLYDQAGISSLDATIGQCLAAGSPCAARAALLLLFRHCGKVLPAFSVPSLDISRGVLMLVAAHCPESFSHALLHLANWHQSLLDEGSSWVSSRGSHEYDAFGAACAALSAFNAGRVEDLQALLSGVTPQSMSLRALAEALSSHPHVLIVGNGLSDVAKYLRSNHADLFVAVLLELAARQVLSARDVLCILDNSCGDKSCDRKLYLEQLSLLSLQALVPMELQHLEELCHLLMDAVSHTARSGAHMSKHDSYCLPQVTTELARHRPAWLNEPSLYPPVVHQMCTHKSGARPTYYTSSKQSDARVASISRWLCVVCHSDLLKLQGLLCCGLMDGERVSAVVQSLLGGAAATDATKAEPRTEPAAALSLQLLGATARWMAAAPAQPGGGEPSAQQQHEVTADLVATLAERSPAALPSLLHSLPLQCVDLCLEDLFGFILKELGKQLTAATTSNRAGLLKSLEDVMTLSSTMLTFDQLLAALPPNGSVAYFLPYLERAALGEARPTT